MITAHRKRKKRRYKRRRGIIETVFSEFENQGLTFTHLRDDDLKLKYGLILQIRHNIKNILRVIVGRYVIIVNYSTNSYSYHHSLSKNYLIEDGVEGKVPVELEVISLSKKIFDHLDL